MYRSLVAALLAVTFVAAWQHQQNGNENDRISNLKKIKHVVLFMQENRAFDHYFGTMAGVRNFRDPNVMTSSDTGKNVFHQKVDQSILSPHPPKDVKFLSPFYLNWAGGDWPKKTQCMIAGTNSWQKNHAAWNHGTNDHWALENSVYSLGYMKKSDIPVQWTLADTFTVGDMYYESTISTTDTNRAVYFSGTMNPLHGSPINGSHIKMGGPVIDNHRIPGCLFTDDGHPMSCYPKRWKTIPEYFEESGITWRVYQDLDNFTDNDLQFFSQYQESAVKGGKLAKYGISYPGLHQFYEDAKNGNLPEVTYIVGPSALSEHPPFMPSDGGWLQAKIANAVMHGKNWDSTALIYSYDETGGWADHVMAPHAPKSEKSEWMIDPYDKSLGLQPIGPGFRVPFYIVSPFTRGGNVFTEHSAHESQLLFVEQWAKAHGKPFYSKEIPQWRRSQLSDLVNAFDFSDFKEDVPYVPRVHKPTQDAITGVFNGGVICEARYGGLTFPPVPWGKQDSSNSMECNKGFKPVRGDLTEGRYLTFEAHGFALSHANSSLTASHALEKHNDWNQLFVLEWQGSKMKDNKYKIKSPNDRYITKSLHLSKDPNEAAMFSLYDQGNGAGHAVTELGSNQRLALTKNGHVSLDDHTNVKIYSVTL